jgi:hypothetical protein
MDGMQREELERLMFFEQTREKAAASYARNPKDADVFFFSPICFFFFFFLNYKLCGGCTVFGEKKATRVWIQCFFGVRNGIFHLFLSPLSWFLFLFLFLELLCYYFGLWMDL